MPQWIDYETGEVHQVQLRTAYNYDMDKASVDAGWTTNEPTLTQQHFAEEADINTIVRKFIKTGELPEPVAMPTFADFTEQVDDYQSAMNMVLEARDSFMQLPPATRERFGNDPQQLMEFLADKDNLAEARKLGLAVPEPEAPKPPEPMLVRVIPDEDKP